MGSSLDFPILLFKAKKQETKEAFERWNTDGDNKFLTFQEFDAGMKSLGITQDRFQSFFSSIVNLRVPAADTLTHYIKVH